MPLDRIVPYDPDGNVWACDWRESQVDGNGRLIQRPRTAHVAGVRGVRALRDTPCLHDGTKDVELVLRRRLQSAQAYNARLHAYNDRLLSIIHALTRQLAVKERVWLGEDAMLPKQAREKIRRCQCAS